MSHMMDDVRSTCLFAVSSPGLILHFLFSTQLSLVCGSSRCDAARPLGCYDIDCDIAWALASGCLEARPRLLIAV